MGEQVANEVGARNVARVFTLDLYQLGTLGWELGRVVGLTRRVHVEPLAAVAGDQRAASPTARG
jgi:hypothetical protein